MLFSTDKLPCTSPRKHLHPRWMCFVYTSLETTAYMELETLVETFSAEMARVKNKLWFQEEWEVQQKKKEKKLLHKNPVYLELLYKYHCYVFLLCPTTLWFQKNQLLFSICSVTLSLKAGLCPKNAHSRLRLEEHTGALSPAKMSFNSGSAFHSYVCNNND